MEVKQRDKILDLVKAICHRVKEKDGYLNKTKLIKYLYLIDVEYCRNHGETFTGFNRQSLNDWNAMDGSKGF